METIIIVLIGGLLLLFLDAMRHQLDEIQQEQDRQDQKIIELLEHIAGAAEAVKKGRTGE